MKTPAGNRTFLCLVAANDTQFPHPSQYPAHKFRRAPCRRPLFVARATTNNVYFNAVAFLFYAFAASRNNIFSKILSGCVLVFDSYSSTYYITASPHQRTFVLHAAQSPNRAVARTGTRCRARKCMTGHSSSQFKYFMK